jgi:hypothetical protein
VPVTEREVWVTPEADITIWAEPYNPSTSVVLRTLVNMRNVKCDELRVVTTHNQPGAATPDFNSYPAGFRISIGEAYQRKAEQFTPLQAVSGKFRIAIQLVNPYYSGTAPLENDPHIFRYASLVSGSLDFQDNAKVERNVEFLAESMDA